MQRKDQIILQKVLSEIDIGAQMLKGITFEVCCQHDDHQYRRAE